MKKEIKKKTINNKCYDCEGKGHKYSLDFDFWTKCETCNGSGIYEDYIYYHTVKDKSGQIICLEGDTLK